MKGKTRAVAAAITAILLAPAILLVAPGVVGAKQAQVVLSDSMAPTIRAGDLVLLAGFDYWTSKVQVGDIIAYQPSGPKGPTVLHRVVAIQSDGGMEYYITQGDANNAPDPGAVGKNTVTGKYLFHIPAYGHLVLFAKSKIGILVFVVAPSLALVAHEIALLNRVGKKRNALPATFEVVRR